MTAYLDRERRAERGRLHRLMRRFNAWLFALLLLALLLAPSVAEAQATVQAQTVQAQTTVRCRWPWQPMKIRLANGRWGWTCFYVWEGAGTMTHDDLAVLVRSSEDKYEVLP